MEGLNFQMNCKEMNITTRLWLHRDYLLPYPFDSGYYRRRPLPSLLQLLLSKKENTSLRSKITTKSVPRAFSTSASAAMVKAIRVHELGGPEVCLPLFFLKSRTPTFVWPIWNNPISVLLFPISCFAFVALFGC